MDLEVMSVEVAAADTAAEVAAEAAAADPSNRPQKKSSQTCSTCRLRKVRCDGRRDVCQNCERLGFSCSFQDTGSPNPDGEALTSFSLPRRRVRLACTNCHSRKARCSGEMPKCARCQSQGIECVYKPTKRSGGVNNTASQGHHGTDSEIESVSSEPPEKRAMTHRDHSGSHHGRHRGSDQQDSGPGGPAPRRGPNLHLPDDELITRTFNNFFRHVHHVPVFSFLHRASLMQRYHAGMMDRALLLSLVGITSLLTDLGPGVREYGTRCIDECEKIVLHDLENPSTIKIQILIFVMKHRMMTRRFTSAFMLAATASRFAFALRLNYENPNLCFLARESRRRLMWSLMTIDSGINGGYPDFTLLPSESMHIQLPCNERNFEFDLPQVTEQLRPIPQRPFQDDVGSLALHVRLLWMRSRVLYCVKNVLAMAETELAQLPELIKVLSQELKGFNEQLPASFKFSESNLQLRAYSPRLCVYIMIHVWWRQCHCDLYRLVLPGLKEALPRSSIDRLDPQFVALCARQCFEHALAMADIFRLILLLDGGLPVTDLDLHVCAYQCARMLYYAYQMNNGEINLTSDQVIEHASRCLQVAKSMSHLPAGAAVVADLEKLMARGLSPNSSPSRPTSPETSRPDIVSHQVLSRHNLVNQMQVAEENEIPVMPMPLSSPSAHVPSPVEASMPTPLSYSTPGTVQQRSRALPFAENSSLDANLSKPFLPPVVPPEGLDNNNAFEGAMDGFDFNLESFGNNGLDSVSWASNDWFNNEYAPAAV
ncbi:hypothetical protein F4778DRAFT_52890 [Xylariomycetidae sp. FL2044]|nr:hypothetical protein F4778DRAFT_52890 [Xylariomycetidae sp. FL2044]